MGAAITVSLVVILAPAGSAVHAPTTLLAPYAGTKSSAGSYPYSVCGTTGGSTAKWKASTGTVTGASKSSFSSCPWVLENATDIAKHWVTVLVPFSVSTGKEYNVSLAFSWKLDPSESVAPGSCPAAINYSRGYDDVFCLWSVSWAFVVYPVEIYDLTNSTVVSPGITIWRALNTTQVDVDHSCYLGKCSSVSSTYTGSSADDINDQGPGYEDAWLYLANGPASGTSTVWANSTSWDRAYHSGSNYTLNPSHSYAVIAQFVFATSVYEYGSNYSYNGNGTNRTISYFEPAGSGSASVSAQPSLYGIKVTSITITAI